MEREIHSQLGQIADILGKLSENSENLIIGKDGKNTIDVSCVEAIIHALEDFYVTVHWGFLLSAWHGARRPRTRALSAPAVETASGGKDVQTSLHDDNARRSIHCSHQLLDV